MNNEEKKPTMDFIRTIVAEDMKTNKWALIFLLFTGIILFAAQSALGGCEVSSLDALIETGNAPEQATAYWLNEQMQPDGARPVCAYPEYLHYNGTGDPRDASGFSCVSPD